MKLRVRRESFLGGLQDVVSVVPSKSTLPILSMVLVEAERDRVIMLATDLDISMRAVIDGDVEVEREGRLCVSARKLSELVRELEAEEITLSHSENMLRVEAGGTYRLVTADPGDFPEIPKLEKGSSLELGAEKLERLIRRTIYAVATDETRPELTGVYTQVMTDEIRMVATNGHRLAQAGLKGSFPEETSYLLPTKALQQLLRIMGGGEQVVLLRGSRGYASFEVGAKTLITRLLEGPFPRYEQVIPRDNPCVVAAPLGTLRAAIRRALVLADPVTRPVKLHLYPEKLRLIVETQNVGESEEEIDVQYQGTELKIGFNGGYLLDLLKTLDSDRVQVALKAGNTAGVFTPVEEGTEEPMLCLVMPLRLTDES